MYNFIQGQVKVAYLVDDSVPVLLPAHHAVAARTLAGVQPSRAAFETVRTEPHLGSLQWTARVI